MPGRRKPSGGQPPRKKRKVMKLRAPRPPTRARPSAPPPEAPAEDPVVAGILEALAQADTLSPRDVAQHIALEAVNPRRVSERFEDELDAVDDGSVQVEENRLQ